MWKRDEAVKPTPCRRDWPQRRQPQRQYRAGGSRRGPSASLSAEQEKRSTVNIGKSVVIKGELNGSEDLTIEGQVEGKIELRQNVLTIGAERQDQGAGVREVRASCSAK